MGDYEEHITLSIRGPMWAGRFFICLALGIDRLECLRLECLILIFVCIIATSL